MIKINRILHLELSPKRRAKPAPSTLRYLHLSKLATTYNEARQKMLNNINTDLSLLSFREMRKMA